MGSFLVILAILGSLFLSVSLGAGILSLFFIVIENLPKQ
jgi:hypothetical protein